MYIFSNVEIVVALQTQKELYEFVQIKKAFQIKKKSCIFILWFLVDFLPEMVSLLKMFERF